MKRKKGKRDAAEAAGTGSQGVMTVTEVDRARGGFTVRTARGKKAFYKFDTLGAGLVVAPGSVIQYRVAPGSGQGGHFTHFCGRAGKSLHCVDCARTLAITCFSLAQRSGKKGGSRCRRCVKGAKNYLKNLKKGKRRG